MATHELMSFLDDYFKKETVDVIVVGYPTNMNGEESASMKQIRPFVNRLSKQYPDKKIVMFDERFTSVIAQKAILDSGIGRMARRNKALVDEVSATIILESFMDSKQYKVCSQLVTLPDGVEQEGSVLLQATSHIIHLQVSLYVASHEVRCIHQVGRARTHN